MKRIDENHSFNINVAKIVGDRKAILLKEIYGWVCKNVQNDRNVRKGVGWTYNSAKAYSEKFPYWSDKSIGRWLRELEVDGWIFSTDQFNKIGFDRTKWFTINADRYDKAVMGETMKDEEVKTWVEQIKLSIAQNEQSTDQDEQPIAQDEELSAQDEQPIPSLTSSFSSRNHLVRDFDKFFEWFWNTYDKGINKHKCEMTLSETDYAERETIIKQLPLYVKSTPDKKYRVAPLKWIEGKRWNDEIIMPDEPQPVKLKVASKQGPAWYSDEVAAPEDFDILKRVIR